MVGGTLDTCCNGLDFTCVFLMLSVTPTCLSLSVVDVRMATGAKKSLLVYDLAVFYVHGCGSWILGCATLIIPSIASLGPVVHASKVGEAPSSKDIVLSDNCADNHRFNHDETSVPLDYSGEDEKGFL